MTQQRSLETGKVVELTALERLVEIEAIRHLKARRVRAIDTKDWATYEALHAPHHYSHNDGERRWDGAKANTDRLALLFAHVTSVHHVHTPELTLISPTAATGIWSLEDHLFWRQADGEHWLHGFGFYHETYEKHEGHWRFTSRQLKRTKVLCSTGADLNAAIA